MPKLQQTVTATTTTELKLDARLRTKLITGLREYKALKLQIDALKAKQDEVKARLATLRDSTGQMSLSIEGEGTTTLVAPTYHKFNMKKFTREGGDVNLYNDCNEVHPKKTFEKVTLPGDKSHVEED